MVGDRTCHWRSDALYIYRDALLAGLIFPFHEFIPIFLIDIQINPSQLSPNSWINIIYLWFYVLEKAIIYL